MPDAKKSIMIHSLDHALTAARAADALGVDLFLVSAPGAGGYAGAAWFAETIAAAREAYPSVEIEAVLDCGDAPGHVVAAFRRDLRAVLFDGPGAARRKLDALAEAHGARVYPDLPEALDLATEADARAACRRWLDSA